jgi:hypothetical protein
MTMKKVIILGCLLALTGLCGTAWAELQNVEVGGQIRTRMRYWHNAYTGPFFNPYSPARVSGRALGRWGIQSRYDWDRADHAYVEQRTNLNVKADFTDNVSAYIALDSFDVWGEDFRSRDYVTGVDTRQNSSDDIEVFEAYIDMNEVGGYPIRLRIGRQAIKLGKGWLVSDNFAPTLGVSYDAVRATWENDDASVDAFWGKLAENFGNFMEDDIDLYGVYATYKAWEPVDVSLYWYYIRDDIIPDDSPGFGPIRDWWENVWNVNGYGRTDFHTVGMRINGGTGGFDYDLEVAYQFGDADRAGSDFGVNGYGDATAEYDNWGADLELGYTFDTKWQPRVYLGGAWLEGEDNRDRTFWEYLNPFYRPDASISFNRMFSSYCYSTVFDIKGGSETVSNFKQIRTGVIVKPTESITTGLKLAYLWVDEPFDMPVGLVSSMFPWWNREVDDDIGATALLFLKYQINSDWFVTFGWEHLFTEDGLTKGSYLIGNGMQYTGGTDDQDGDYFFIDTGLKF